MTRTDGTVPGARLQRQTGGIPILRPTPLTQPFWAGVDAHELRYQRCEDCGTAIFNPAHVCRACTSDRLAWTVSTGRGSVYSWTICWRPMAPTFSVPYAPVIVDLDEGYQMLSNLVDCAVEEIRVGLPLEVVFVPIGDRTLPCFRPGGGA